MPSVWAQEVARKRQIALAAAQAHNRAENALLRARAEGEEFSGTKPGDAAEAARADMREELAGQVVNSSGPAEEEPAEESEE